MNPDSPANSVIKVPRPETSGGAFASREVRDSQQVNRQRKQTEYPAQQIWRGLTVRPRGETLTDDDGYAGPEIRNGFGHLRMEKAKRREIEDEAFHHEVHRKRQKRMDL